MGGVDVESGISSWIGEKELRLASVLLSIRDGLFRVDRSSTVLSHYGESSSKIRVRD